MDEQVVQYSLLGLPVVRVEHIEMSPQDVELVKSRTLIQQLVLSGEPGAFKLLFGPGVTIRSKPR